MRLGAQKRRKRKGKRDHQLLHYKQTKQEPFQKEEEEEIKDTKKNTKIKDWNGYGNHVCTQQVMTHESNSTQMQNNQAFHII